MKMLKKMAALLLAGVMALALFTACGDDSAPSFAQKAEEKVFAAMSEATGVKENDAELKAMASKSLDLVKDGKVNVKAMLSLNVLEDGDEENSYRVKAVSVIPDMKANDYYTAENYTVAVVTPETLNNLDMSAFATLVKEMSDSGVTFEKMGVAAKTVDGKTYMSIAVQYTGKVLAQPAH